MWSEPEAVSEVLLYDPAFLDPSLPTGFWFCADPEDVLAVQVNAGCLRTLGSWEYIGRYLMARHANPKMPEHSVEEWLDRFNTFSIYEVFPELLELWRANNGTLAESKKNEPR